MSRPTLILLCSLAMACGDEGDKPLGGDDSAIDTALPACPGAWREHDEGIWLQAHACLAWSPESTASMDWYAAVSPESAVAGGCSTHCDDEPGHCSQLDTAGITSWRLPSMDELQAAGHDSPPMDDLTDMLWSRDSVDMAEDMAYQMELETPEGVFMAGKDQDGMVRCVADL